MTHRPRGSGLCPTDALAGLLLVCALALPSLAWSQAGGTWVSHGPGRGNVNVLVVDPTTPTTVHLGSTTDSTLLHLPWGAPALADIPAIAR